MALNESLCTGFRYHLWLFKRNEKVAEHIFFAKSPLRHALLVIIMDSLKDQKLH
jgi:hypothetical protein